MPRNVREIETKFTGDASGLVRAARSSESALERLGRAVRTGFDNFYRIEEAERHIRSLRRTLGGVATELRQSERALDRVGRQAQRSGRQVSGFGKSFKGGIAGIAGIAVGAGAAIAGIGRAFEAAARAAVRFGVEAVKVSAEVERSLGKIAGITNVPREEIEKYLPVIRRLAHETGRDVRELAEAFFFVNSAGRKGAEGLEILERAAKLSAVGLGNMNELVTILAAAINAYGAENLTAGKASDVLIATIEKGIIVTEDLARQFGETLPFARSLGVGFDEVGAAFAALTRTGTPAFQAATQIKNILKSLVAPTKQTSDAFKEFGIDIERFRMLVDDQGILKSLVVLRDLLTEQTGSIEGAREAFREFFPDVRATSGVLDQLGPSLEENIRIMEYLTTTTGNTEKAFEEWRKTLLGQFSRVEKGLVSLRDAFGTQFSEAITDGLTTIGDSLAEVTTAIENLDPETINAIASAIGAVAAAISDAIKVIPDAVTLLGNLAEAFIGTQNAVYARAQIGDPASQIALLEQRRTLLQEAAAGAGRYTSFEFGGQQYTQSQAAEEIRNLGIRILELRQSIDKNTAAAGTGAFAGGGDFPTVVIGKDGTVSISGAGVRTPPTTPASVPDVAAGGAGAAAGSGVSPYLGPGASARLSEAQKRRQEEFQRRLAEYQAGLAADAAAAVDARAAVSAITSGATAARLRAAQDAQTKDFQRRLAEYQAGLAADAAAAVTAREGASALSSAAVDQRLRAAQMARTAEFQRKLEAYQAGIAADAAAAESARAAAAQTRESISAITSGALSARLREAQKRRTADFQRLLESYQASIAADAAAAAAERSAAAGRRAAVSAITSSDVEARLRAAQKNQQEEFQRQLAEYQAEAAAEAAEAVRTRAAVSAITSGAVADRLREAQRQRTADFQRMLEEYQAEAAAEAIEAVRTRAAVSAITSGAVADRLLAARQRQQDEFARQLERYRSGEHPAAYDPGQATRFRPYTLPGHTSMEELVRQTQDRAELGKAALQTLGGAIEQFARDVQSGASSASVALRLVSTLISGAVSFFTSDAGIRLLGGVPGKAAGGPVGGLTLVGEAGPELVDFRRPGMVYSNEQLAQAIGRGGGMTNNIVINSDNPAANRQAVIEGIAVAVDLAEQSVSENLVRPSEIRSAAYG